MESNLDCVAVTDHNSGGWIDKLKEKNEELRKLNVKPDWYKSLTIFPGVEITVADSRSGVHLLAIFDPNCDSNKVIRVLGACGITSGHGDKKHTETEGLDFAGVVNKIKNADGIAIPAHIDHKKGLLEETTSLTPELEKSLKSIFVAEFCDPNKFDDADPQLKKAVEGLAKVRGSDSHKPDDIGKRYSWVKMSRPSIEGVRLALQDQEFCVKNQEEDPNHLPDVFLSKLTIENMNHCGRKDPFTIPLHPHFNSVIGGRGTGKSTILESIRIALRHDQSLATEAPNVKKTWLDKFMRLSSEQGAMLNNTEILLELHRRGKNYRVHWRQSGEGAVLEEKTDEKWKIIETDKIKERFPINIFSQKQIDELASNSRGLLNIIDRSPEVDKAEWDSRWKSIESQFLQLRERKRELLRQLSKEEQIHIDLNDVENDLNQYEEKGHGEILKQYQKRSQQKNALPDNRIFDDLSAEVRRVASDAELSDFPAHLFEEQDESTDEIRSIHEQSSQDLKKIGEDLGKIAGDVDKLKNERMKSISSSKWHQALQASIDNYNALVKEYEEKQSELSISVYGEWVQNRDLLQQQLNKLKSIRKEVAETDKQIENCLLNFQQLRLELFKKREEFLHKVIGSNDFVQMDLVQYGEIRELESEYRSILHLGDGPFANAICAGEGILWDLYKWEDNLSISESDLPEIISEIKEKTLDIANGKRSEFDRRFDNRLQDLLKEQPAAFDHLDSWWPEDMLRVKYAQDPNSGEFKNVEKGSAGQKASAILAFLLSHGKEPLIIDQPEDDLDNALIYDLIVKQIHENKSRRQIIIATHNPNIVVNGDSELVHVLKFAVGQIQLDRQEGLEESGIRKAICDIMEGGEEAFEKRYRRIKLELNHA